MGIIPTNGYSLDLKPKLGTLPLSRGKLFQRVYKVPYVFDAGTESQILITDSAGDPLATFDGDVGTNTITFTEFASDVDGIPHGANYEFSVSYPDTGEPTGIEYGIVVRKEPRFTLLPPDDSTLPVGFSQDFTFSTLIGPKWIIKDGTPEIDVNQPTHANAIGVGAALLGNKGAMQYYAPLNGDDVTVNIALRSPGNGYFTLAVCADYAMSEWIGVTFDSLANTVQFVIGTGSTTMTNQGSTTANTIAAETDTYQLKFDSLSDTLHLFKNGSGTALASFTYSNHLVGLGHRYFGLVWVNPILGVAPQVISINAQDGI